MDVTPTEPMYRAMQAMADSLIGPEPLRVEKSGAANQRREKREAFFELMHRFVAMTMREGARRAFEERGMATTAAPMKGRDGS